MGNYVGIINPVACEIVSFWYDKEKNILTDDNGWPVYDIFRYITPNQYRLFLEKEGVFYIKKSETLVYEFNYPFDEEDEEDYY